MLRTRGGLGTVYPIRPGCFVFYSIPWNSFRKGEGGEKCRNAKHFFKILLRFGIFNQRPRGFSFLFFYYSFRLLDSRPFSLFPMPSRFLSLCLVPIALCCCCCRKSRRWGRFFLSFHGAQKERRTPTANVRCWLEQKRENKALNTHQTRTVTSKKTS